MKISNKVGKYILIGIGASILIAYIYGQIIIVPKFEKKGRYTIGIFNKYLYKSGGAYDIFFSYKAKNTMFKNRTNYPSDDFDGSEVGKRFIVKYVENEENLSYILLEYPVPDSIKEAPREGWKELPEWAKEKK